MTGEKYLSPKGRTSNGRVTRLKCLKRKYTSTHGDNQNIHCFR
jgi:hypothetical protein